MSMSKITLDEFLKKTEEAASFVKLTDSENIINEATKKLAEVIGSLKEALPESEGKDLVINQLLQAMFMISGLSFIQELVRNKMAEIKKMMEGDA